MRRTKQESARRAWARVLSDLLGLRTWEQLAAEWPNIRAASCDLIVRYPGYSGDSCAEAQHALSMIAPLIRLEQELFRAQVMI